MGKEPKNPRTYVPSRFNWKEWGTAIAWMFGVWGRLAQSSVIRNEHTLIHIVHALRSVFQCSALRDVLIPHNKIVQLSPKNGQIEPVKAVIKGIRIPQPWGNRTIQFIFVMQRPFLSPEKLIWGVHIYRFYRAASIPQPRNHINLPSFLKGSHRIWRSTPLRQLKLLQDFGPFWW